MALDMSNQIVTLQQLWQKTWGVVVEPIQYCDVFEDILQRYQEPQRHYHTVQHLYECMLLWQQVYSLLQQPQIVALALWFHDSVYYPQANDNEEQSAALARQVLTKTSLPANEIEQVCQYILATKQHHNPFKDSDLDFVLDIDLAILASSATRFAEYEQQIRQEYIWVDEAIYRIKRHEVLQSFSAQVPLYQTNYFGQKYESIAKQNLQL